MKTWKIRYRYGDSWTTGASDWYFIENPTTDITLTLKTTRQKKTLYDGTIGRLIPSNKSNYEETSLQWDFMSGSSQILKTTGDLYSIKSIVDYGYPVEIRTHNLDGTNPEYWTGYFATLPRVYKVGMYPVPGVSPVRYETYYDVSCEFDLMTVSTTSN